ncbi:hypothetical protein BN77_2595 [Rhizobium mesoamericanum STM3625]|uniref:Uncharacterized protein n=1 Tax=Rhizobium mesoamericanum STM3625 TaxID=1211777 RepID=K0PW38_9HYPH|nr:hypothetical protein BN77_2595 [Rhizobium mesoamericanum STM3625]
MNSDVSISLGFFRASHPYDLSILGCIPPGERSRGGLNGPLARVASSLSPSIESLNSKRIAPVHSPPGETRPRYSLLHSRDPAIRLSAVTKMIITNCDQTCVDVTGSGFRCLRSI